MKEGPKRIAVVLGLVAAVFGYRELAARGIVSRPGMLKTLIPLNVDAPDAEVLAARTDVKAMPLPSSNVSTISGPVVRFLVWAWNANMAALFANGGSQTTKGSLMEQNGVKVRFERQDDSGVMRDQQIAFAEKYCKGGGEPAEGIHFATIMGDGGAQYLGPANQKLKTYGADCQLEVVAIFGYSRGEDKFMGPADWKSNPAAAKGGLVAGVLRDGDWNLAMRWEHENNIPNNPDERTYDPDAVNWVNTDTYIDAAQKYIAGYCEDRPLKNKPSEKRNVCVQGVVTWTPGDVMVAKKKGGLVSLMDTGSAIFQMPCVVIGLKKWDAAHADIVAGMIAAAGEGADQIRANTQAMKRAGEVSKAVYKEQDADYWIRYFKGVTEKDATGTQIALGGSSVSNLADQFQSFGLAGGPNLFKATYETFGAVDVQQYPNLFKSYPPTASIQNTRYLQMAATKSENVEKGAAEKVTYDSTPMKEVSGHRAYAINFATGSDQILPNSFTTLDEVADYLVTENTKVSLIGHTDNTGSADKNLLLSEERAQMVKAYLVSKGRSAIPDNRIARVEGHGQTEPVASNDTAAGRAQNRRVELILGR